MKKSLLRDLTSANKWSKHSLLDVKMSCFVNKERAKYGGGKTEGFTGIVASLNPIDGAPKANQS